MVPVNCRFLIGMRSSTDANVWYSHRRPWGTPDRHAIASGGSESGLRITRRVSATALKPPLAGVWAWARTRSAAPLVIGSRLGQHPIANYVPLKLLPSVLHGQKNCHVLRPKYSLYVVQRGLWIPQRNLLPHSLGHRLVFARSKAVARDAPTLCHRWWKDRRELPADADSRGDTPPVALTS